jgi:hypothetical protein
MSLTRNRLIWISIGLAVLVLLLSWFLIARLQERAVFGVLEVLVTFAIGLLGNVLATGWFVSMFQRDDRLLLAEIHHTCQVLYQRGIWVAKRALLENDFYEKHYSNAMKVDVLGIANKGFMRNFYPEYLDHDFKLNKATLAKPLFKRLKTTSGFLVTVLFLDPNSQYAKDRNGEPGNERTIEDLIEIVKALEKIRSAYENEESDKRKIWKLKGSLEFKMFDKHPQTSIFQARRDDFTEKSIMVVGLLPKNMSGDQCPSVIIPRDRENEQLFDSYAYHLEEIKKTSKTFLCWDDRGLTWPR